MGLSYNIIPTISGIGTYTYQVGNYISIPVATPANFGDPLEGGYYTGMIWNQLVQTSTTTTIATGVKTFTVPDMTSTPDPLRIALVGTGGMGTVHYHNYQHLPNCQVTALVGVTTQSQ